MLCPPLGISLGAARAKLNSAGCCRPFRRDIRDTMLLAAGWLLCWWVQDAAQSIHAITLSRTSPLSIPKTKLDDQAERRGAKAAGRVAAVDINFAGDAR